ncbi:hypothetical protein ACT4US_20285 [Bacillus sp. HC-Mk]
MLIALNVSLYCFLARDLRVRELQDRKSLIDKTLAVRIAERNSGKFEEGSSEYEQIIHIITEIMSPSCKPLNS